jgi:DtxR family transcriptional regulator, Mn-dependent transcriptional regulator
MEQLTFTEENYLKAIYTIQYRKETAEVSVNEIADRMQTKPATVTDMLRKLSEKELIHYEKYKKIQISNKGLGLALQIVRKHRLWETFLFDKLNFTWDEVHEVAEQLEHIQSQKLIDGLDEFLGHPEFDPHGDPIPNARGEMPSTVTIMLSESGLNIPSEIVGVRDTSPPFLQQLQKIGLQIGTLLKVTEKMPYDNSILVQIEGQPDLMLSEKVAMNILIHLINP